MPADRAQFEAAARKVSTTAPPGLSQDEFYKLVDGELAKSAAPTGSPEPDTYWGGFGKGLKEGVVGGAKGFATGMVKSPGALVSGMAQTIRHPIQSVKGAVEGIGQIPAAVRAAGQDPEHWGKQVGSLTGQTMLGLGAPKAIPAAGRAVAKAAPPIARATARGAGASMSELGRQRMFMGFGGLLSGNPAAGMAGIALSPALRAGGRALTKWGTPEGATPAGPTPVNMRAAKPTADLFPKEGVGVERQFRALARQPILTPEEFAQFEQLKRMSEQRASHVGMSFASGGKRGIP